MSEQDANRVGVGVDLYDGREVLLTLKEIHSTMLAISNINIRPPSYSQARKAAESNPYNPGHPDQLRLFSEGLSKQGTLFTQAELKKTEITGREENKRRGLRQSQLTQEARFKERLRRDDENSEYKSFKRTEELRRKARENMAKLREQGSSYTGHRGQEGAERRFAKEMQGVVNMQRYYEGKTRQWAERMQGLNQRGLAMGLNTRSFNNERELANRVAERQAAIQFNAGRAENSRSLVAKRIGSVDVYQDLEAQRKLFKRYRDHERDDLTQKWRDELAIDLRAQREKLRQQREFDRMRLEARKQNARQEVEEMRHGPITFSALDLPKQRRLAKSYRDDPDWQVHRDTLARQTRAERLQERDRLVKNQRLQEETNRQDAAIQRQRAEEDARLLQQERNRQRNYNALQEQKAGAVRGYEQGAATKYGQTGNRKAFLQQAADADLGNFHRSVETAVQKVDRLRDANTRLQNELTGRKFQGFRGETEQVFTRLGDLNARLFVLRKELATPTGMGRTRDLVLHDLRTIEKEIGTTVESIRRLRAQSINANFRTGPNNPNNPPNLNNPNLFNDKGFFTSIDMVGRISRNILLYQVVSQSTYGLIDYVKNAVMAARTADDFGRALEFASEKSRSNTEANFQLAESLRDLGVSRQQGRAAVTEAARFVEGIDPNGVEALTRVTANIAASRGLGIDKTDELVEQLRRRESKFYKRLFGTTVEEIYRKDAASKVLPYKDLLVTDEKKEVRSDKQLIDDYVASMTEAQKERAAYNFILSQAPRFEGEAAKRSQELAGRMDTMVNRFKDGQEAIGQFITEIKALNSVLELGAYYFDKLAVGSSRMQRTGSGGTVSGYDAEKYLSERNNTTRQRLLGTINETAGPLALGALATGAFAFLGRRPARQQFRTDTYKSEYATALKELDGNAQAAAQQAKIVAQEARPGLIRSVKAGMQRVTIGMNESVGGMFSGLYQELKNEALQRRAARTGLPVSINGIPQGNVAFAESTRGLSPQTLARRERATVGREYGGTGGGLLGAGVGATLGYIIADKIEAGPITATGLTIIGGIAGNAAGTALGNAAGGALGAAGIGSFLTPVTIAAIAAGVIATMATGSYLYDAEQALLREERRAGIEGLQRKERMEARREGREYFYDPDNVGKRLSFDEVTKYRKTSAPNIDPNMQNQIIENAKNRASTYQPGFIAGWGEYIFGRKTPQELGKSLEVLSVSGNQFAGTIEYIDRVTGKVTRSFYDLGQVMSQAEMELQRQREASLGRTLTEIEKLNLSPEQMRQAQLGTLGRNQGFSGEFQKRRDDFWTDADKYNIEWEEKRKANDERLKQNRINDQSQALSVLRSATQGSFKIVEDIASVASPNNPFVKIMADMETIGHRMREQWGWAGKAAIEYFTKLEQKKASLLLITESFNSMSRAQDLLNKRFKSNQEYFGPGYSSRQTQGASVAQAAVDSVLTTYESRKREAGLGGYLGFNADYYKGTQYARDTLAQLGIQGTLYGFGNGAASRQTNMIVAQARQGLLGQFSNQQIANDPYLKQVFYETEGDIRREAELKLQDELKKARFIDEDDARLQRNLSEARNRAESLRLQGKDPKAVQEELDKYIVSRLEGIPVKDLSFDNFQLRQQALQRQAETEVRREQEARAAVEQGLAYQKGMLEEIQKFRQEVLAGNASVIIQVLNDTQARIDQQSLQDTNVGYKVPLLNGNANQNPYSNLNDRYNRGGTK